MDEDKQEILDKLFEALKLCRATSTIEKLEYDERKGVVFACFKKGIPHVINVECDSGFAMIKDVANHLLGS